MTASRRDREPFTVSTSRSRQPARHDAGSHAADARRPPARQATSAQARRRIQLSRPRNPAGAARACATSPLAEFARVVGGLRRLGRAAESSPHTPGGAPALEDVLPAQRPDEIQMFDATYSEGHRGEGWTLRTHRAMTRKQRSPAGVCHPIARRTARPVQPGTGTQEIRARPAHAWKGALTSAPAVLAHATRSSRRRWSTWTCRGISGGACSRMREAALPDVQLRAPSTSHVRPRRDGFTHATRLGMARLADIAQLLGVSVAARPTRRSCPRSSLPVDASPRSRRVIGPDTWAALRRLLPAAAAPTRRRHRWLHSRRVERSAGRHLEGLRDCGSAISSTAGVKPTMSSACVGAAAAGSSRRSRPRCPVRSRRRDRR